MVAALPGGLEHVPCRSRTTGAARFVLGSDAQLDRWSIGRDQLVGLAREDAREHERATLADQRGQQRREQLERRGQDVGEDQLIRTGDAVRQAGAERDPVGARVRLGRLDRGRVDVDRIDVGGAESARRDR